MGLITSDRYSNHIGRKRLGTPRTELRLKHSGSQFPSLSNGYRALNGVWRFKQDSTRHVSAQSGPEEEECVGTIVPTSLDNQRMK